MGPRPVPYVCIVTNNIADHIYTTFGQLLEDFHQAWFKPQQLFLLPYNTAGVLSMEKLASLWSTKNQQIVYNEHKRLHSVKFQSVVLPNE